MQSEDTILNKRGFNHYFENQFEKQEDEIKDLVIKKVKYNLTQTFCEKIEEEQIFSPKLQVASQILQRKDVYLKHLLSKNHYNSEQRKFKLNIVRDFEKKISIIENQLVNYFSSPH